ncbi:MAG: Gfo/Idh/MocA family oxidoreductase [Planctomycetes bacterium]|nr:Gfo/Idh/MocA family oxidoreductase [Planctomycetota bacterium]
MPKPIHVGLIGTKFMGRAHSNAFSQVAHFFDLPLAPVLQIAVGRNAKELAAFAGKWGWQQITTRWQDLCEDDELDLVDVATPNDVHAEPAIALLEAGKHVACEKPLAGTLADARAMRDAAKKAKRSKTFVWYNYRRCPAVALAHQLVKEGRIGRVYHVRATYLQSWGGPSTPLLWRFQKEAAGSGAHGDLNAHIIDMCRFVTGEELTEVHGAVARTFVEERTIPGTKKKGKSTVDDAVLFLASLSGGGVASFEATRLAAPHQNANSLEVNGEKGSLRFDFEDMNLLRFHDATRGPREGGWTRIMCTSAAGKHPYAGQWWPDAHVLGYEHGFVNMLADVLRVLGGEKPEVPLPDFEDAYQTQRVLEAALLSAKERCAIKLSAVK